MFVGGIGNQNPHVNIEVKAAPSGAMGGKSYKKAPHFLKALCEKISQLFWKAIDALKSFFHFGRKPNIPAPVPVNPAPIAPVPVPQPAVPPKQPLPNPGPQDFHKALEQDPRNHGLIFTSGAARLLNHLPVGSALLRFSPDLQRFFISRKEKKGDVEQIVNYPVENKTLAAAMQELGIKDLVPRPAQGNAAQLAPQGANPYANAIAQDPRNHGHIFSGEAARRLQNLPAGSALLRFSPDLKKFFITRKENKGGKMEIVNYPIENKPLAVAMQELGIKDLVPKPERAPLFMFPAAPVAPAKPDIPAAAVAVDDNILQLAKKKDSLSNAEKLQVLKNLKSQFTKNKSHFDPGGLSNIMRTLDAAEHLVANQKHWLDFVDRMRKKKVNRNDISKEILNKLKFVSHPDTNDLAPLLLDFSNNFVRGYLIAAEKGIVGNFLKNAVLGSDICFEARAKTVQSWLEANVVEDAAVILNYDSKKDDHFQILSKALDPFKETQLREYYSKNYRNGMLGFYAPGVGQKVFFYSDTWVTIKNTIELQKTFYTNFYNKQKFVEFLKTQMKLPLKLEKTANGVTEITEANLSALIDQLIDVAGDDPFDYAEQVKALQAAKKPAVKK